MEEVKDTKEEKKTAVQQSSSTHDVLETLKVEEKRKKGEWLAPYQYKKGQSGNPSGRAKGISLKEYVKQKFNTMTEEEREEFMHGLSKSDIWRMAEGNPDNKTDITTAGEKIAMTPQVIEIASKFEEELKKTL